VMIDEAHERSSYTDLLLGVLKKYHCFSSSPTFFAVTHASPLTLSLRIRKVRPELRIIISSATIEAQQFVDFFNTTNSLPPSSSDSDRPTKRSRWDKREKEVVKRDEAVMVRLEGKSFPVEVCYLEKPTNDVVLKAVETVFDIHLKASLSSW